MRPPPGPGPMGADFPGGPHPPMLTRPLLPTESSKLDNRQEEVRTSNFWIYTSTTTFLYTFFVYPPVPFSHYMTLSVLCQEVRIGRKELAHQLVTFISPLSKLLHTFYSGKSLFVALGWHFEL